MKLSKGNNKIGKVANVSLTPIKACKGCADVCGKDCYAMKAYKQYPATKAAWDHNFEQATNDVIGFFNELHDSLKSYKGRFFRWHVAGDILDMNYFKRMVLTARNYPNIKFLAFTKQYDIIAAYIQYMKEFSGESPANNFIPENLTIIFSAWPGLPMNNPYNFPVAYMQDGTVDNIPADAIECPGLCEGCNMCWALNDLKRDVVFKKH